MEVVLISFFHLLDNLELPKKKKPQLKNLLIRLACEPVYGTLSRLLIDVGGPNPPCMVPCLGR